MKKYVLTIICLLTMLVVPALAGVWVAQSSYGPTCYLVKASYTYNDFYFNSNYNSTDLLIGTGVVSGSNFTGLLKLAPSYMTAHESTYSTYYGYGYSASAQPVPCGNNANCAFTCALGNGSYINNGYKHCPNTSASYNPGPATVSVISMPFTTAQPTACW